MYQDVQWYSVTCIKNDEWWLSHNYMIMQSNMTMNAQVIKRKRWKLPGNISRNGYGKAIIGRDGGYFEEDIMRFMCDREYHITEFWMHLRSLHHVSMWERAMHDTVEASKLRKGKSAYNPWTHISHKELIYLLQTFISPLSKVLLRMPLGGYIGRKRPSLVPDRQS